MLCVRVRVRVFRCSCACDEVNGWSRALKCDTLAVPFYQTPS